MDGVFNQYSRARTNKKSCTHTAIPPNSELHRERALDLRLEVEPQPGELPFNLGPTPVAYDESTPWDEDPNKDKLFYSNGRVEAFNYIID